MLHNRLWRIAPVVSSFVLVIAAFAGQAGCSSDKKSGGGGDDDDNSGGAGGAGAQGGSGNQGGASDPCGDGVCNIVDDTCNCPDCDTEPLCLGTGGGGGIGQGGFGQGGNPQGGNGQGGFGQGGFGQGGLGMGGGGPLMCDDTVAAPCTDAVANNCICVGCSADCNNPISDCVCPSCAADAYCTDPANCDGDGICSPYTEGCGCADCAAHPQCP